MTVAIILGIVISAFSLIFLFRKLTDYFLYKLGENPFRLGKMLLLSSATLAIIIGLDWRVELVKTHGDVLNGTLTVATGFIIILAMVAFNFQRYGLKFGLLTSIFQGVGVPVFIALSPLVLIASFINNAGVRYVRILRD